MTAKISIILPWPISINRLYGFRQPKKSTCNKLGYGYKYLTKEGQNYTEQALWLIKMQVKNAYFRNAVIVNRLFCPPSNRVYDHANFLKILDDILTKSHVIKDDQYIFDHHNYKGIPLKPGYVLIEIEDYVHPSSEHDRLKQLLADNMDSLPANLLNSIT